MVKWKGYEPKSPEAKAAAERYEPPEAVIEEAPPVKAPKPSPPPKPPPPTLEPVIAQPYVPPVGGRPVEWASLKGAKTPEGKPDPLAIDKTKPTVLVTPDGVRHYTPYSTMWKELGMRTEKDYDKYLRTGEASQYVGITEGVDKPVLVSRREMAKASKLTGEEQFKALIEAGAIPRGSKFMPGPNGYQGKDWSYIHPDTIKKYKGRLLAQQAASQIELGTAWRIVPAEEGEVAGVLPPGSPVNKFAKGGLLNLNDAVGAGFIKASDYEGWNVTQAQIDKVVERNNALKVLADKGYKGYGDRYRVVDALVSDDLEAIKALETVFSERDLNAAKKWIDRHWGAHGRFIAGKEIPLTKKVQEALRKVTPWEEGKGETLLEYLQEHREKIPVPSPLAALAVPVAVTPIPWDDLLLYSAIAGGVAFGLWEVSEKLKSNIATFRSQFERSPMPEDLVLVSSDGMAQGIADIDPKKLRIPGVSIVPIDPKIPSLFPRDLRQQIPGITITKIDPKIPPISTKKVEPALYLPTPMITMDELTGLQAGMIKAVADVAVAEEGLKKALPKTQTIPVDWNKILEEARQVKRKEDIEKIFSASAFKFLPQVPPDVSAHFTRNYQEYLRRRAILESARKSYVASLNPTPIMGKASDEAVGIAASFLTSKALGLASPQAGEQLDVYLARVLGAKFSSVARTATSTATKTFAKALAQGKTATQATTQTLTATQTAIQTRVRTLTKPVALTQTQVKAITQAMARTATATAINTAVARAAITPAVATTALTLLPLPQSDSPKRCRPTRKNGHVSRSPKVQ